MYPAVVLQVMLQLGFIQSYKTGQSDETASPKAPLVPRSIPSVPSMDLANLSSYRVSRALPMMMINLSVPLTVAALRITGSYHFISLPGWLSIRGANLQPDFILIGRTHTLSIGSSRVVLLQSPIICTTPKKKAKPIDVSGTRYPGLIL